MNKKFLFPTLIVLISLIISSCGAFARDPDAQVPTPVPTATLTAEPAATEASIATELPAATEVSTQAPTAISLPTLVRTPTLEPVVLDPFAGRPECQYVDTGASQPYQGEALTQEGGKWVLDLSKIGCAAVFEGRRDKSKKIHEDVVLLDLNGQTVLADDDGKFRYDEGSVWLFDRRWNMGDFGTEYTPIALKLAADKRVAMRAADYEWSINLYESNGNMTTYPIGATKLLSLGDAGNHCDFAEPQAIPIHGETQKDGSYKAAIGAADCTTYAWIDGATTPEHWTGQRDAKNKVSYTTIHVIMMPATWDQARIDAWLATHPNGQ